MPTRRPYRGGTTAKGPDPKCAWVVLLMNGKADAPGALAVAQSLHLVRTRHALVCMVTPDVPEETRAQLGLVYDRIVEVPYLAHGARPLASARQVSPAAELLLEEPVRGAGASGRRGRPSKTAEQFGPEDRAPADFPYRVAFMPPPLEMFARLQAVAALPPPKWERAPGQLALLRRTFPEEFDSTDSLTDHFVEPARILCRERGEISPAAAWRKIKGSGRPLPPDPRARRELVYAMARGCNLFNNALAVYLLSCFGARDILDCTAGWGDRLVAAHAAGARFYRGWDTNPALQPVYAAIGATLPGGLDWAVELGPFEAAAARFEPDGDMAARFDTALFCPPFFDKEVYQGPETSTATHPALEKWYGDFYRPAVRAAAKGLRPGGHFLAYVTDGRMRREAGAVLDEAGFEYLGTIGFQQVLADREGAVRDTFVWRRGRASSGAEGPARESRALASTKRASARGGPTDHSSTKWNCLRLTEYDKVVLADTDSLFLLNCDDLFDLRAPAACYSAPRADPNPYHTGPASGEPLCDLPHGSRVPAAAIMAALRQRTFVGGGSLVVLKPDAGKHEQLLSLLGAGHSLAAPAPDEASLAELYAREGTDWTHIHQRYVAIPWEKEWVSRDIHAYRYLGQKPWAVGPGESPNLADWWRVAGRFLEKHGGHRETFHPAVTSVAPLDADCAQLRLTGDIRSLILAGRGSRDGRGATHEANNILERWLMALVNTPGPADSYAEWARVYRRSTLEEWFNNKLAGELVAKRFAADAEAAGRLVTKILATVAHRLGRPPRPSGAAPACDEGELRYGPHFRAERGARLGRLVELGGCEKALAVALRYAVVVSTGQQWGLPQAHVDYLYGQFHVRNEAFASPLNARLLGKPGARFCSIFPDTDAPFGSIGDFLAQDLAADLLDGNWVVNPPFVEDLLTRAARRVTDALSPTRPQTFFFVVPAWTDSEMYGLLHESPFLAAELRLEPGHYFYEDPVGRRVDTKAASIYFALSSEGRDVRARLAGALRQLTEL